MEPTVQPMQQNTPESKWPGAFGIFKPSRRVVALSLWPYLGVIVLSAVLGGNGGGGENGEFSAVAGVVSFLGFLISVFFTTAGSIILLNASESIKIGFVDALKRTMPFYLRAVGLTLLLAIIAVVSLLLLIVPFFIIMPRLVLATYHLIDKDLGVIESLRASWETTKGHSGKVYGVIGVNILMALLFITIIGIPVAIYLLVAYSAATILLYKYIKNGVVQSPVKQEIEVPYPSTNA